MAIITITFLQQLNVSAQVGDTAYFVPTTGAGGFDINSNAVVEIGIIQSIDEANNIILCDTNLPSAQQPVDGDFILFSKDNKANLSSLLGYYALVRIRNNSLEKAEMFSIGADFVESSK